MRRLTYLNNLPLLGFETRQVAREAHTGTHNTTLTSFMGDVVQTMNQCKEAPWSRGIYELGLEGCIGAYFSPHSLSIQCSEETTVGSNGDNENYSCETP